MSAREKMLKSAIRNMMEDYDKSVDRMSIMAELDNMPFILKKTKPTLHSTCYMCDSEDCEEIRYGNKKQASINVMLLCKSRQKTMAEFLADI